MAPKKLSDADKQQILDLYRQSEETTSSLANRYGVSVSTISRLLKQTLDDEEYEGLIQQKRAAGRGQLELDIAEEDATPDVVESPAAPILVVQEPTSSPGAPRRRRRPSAASQDEDSLPLPVEPPVESVLELPSLLEEQSLGSPEPLFASDATVLQEALKANGQPDATEPEEDFDELDEDLEDDDLDDEDDDEDEDFAGEDKDFSELPTLNIPQGKSLRILPFSEASIPRTCYLVVDRASELITRPLKDFASLGQVPDAEVQERTLPVFDNHRVAKRFMRRMQRVVKVPDGRVLQKVSPYLQAKGITHLLIDGQVYSLQSNPVL